MVVVVFHVTSFVAVPERLGGLWRASPLGALANGPAAVHLFFVLSGFVLALTLACDAAPGRIARYAVRRLFRIQPPYMAAVLLAWIASQLVVPPSGAHPAAGGAIPWVRVPAARLPIALVFPSMAFGLLPVGWSLFVELAMSAVFPLLFALARRTHAGVALAIGLALLQPLDRRLSFLVFTLDFALGIALFLERDRLGRALARLPGWAAWVWMGAGLELLQLPDLLGWKIGGWRDLARSHGSRPLLAMAAGSALLVAGALHLPAVRRVFSAPLARFYGRISYSLYLVHLTVLLVPLSAWRLGDAGLPWPWAAPLFAAVLAVATALSMLGFRFVEEPSIRAGRAVIRAGAALAQPGARS